MTTARPLSHYVRQATRKNAEAQERFAEIQEYYETGELELDLALEAAEDASFAYRDLQLLLTAAEKERTALDDAITAANSAS